jgi:Ca2+-binding EF-hand superfamily protein
MSDKKMELMNFEMQVDERVKHIRQYLDIRTGFGEDHTKSRVLLNLIKHFDLDHRGIISVVEFGKVLEQMAIVCSPDELQAAFNRFDIDEKGILTFKEFSDAFFGVTYAPLGDPDTRHLVENIRSALIARTEDGVDAFRGLTRLFLIRATKQPGDDRLTMTKEMTFNTLQEYGVQITIPECTTLAKKFDRFGRGTLCVPDFLHGLRGFMPQSRISVVREAFCKIDSSNKGYVTLDQLSAALDGSAVAAVGRRRSLVAAPSAGEHAYSSFVKEWTSLNTYTRGKITWQDFLDYYRDISAATVPNLEFDTFVRQTWRMHVPGTTPRICLQRFVVKHRDGRKSIEEIECKLSPTDVEEIKRALEVQLGITDVSSIEVYH